MGLKSLFPCWLSAGGRFQCPEATHSHGHVTMSKASNIATNLSHDLDLTFSFSDLWMYIQKSHGTKWSQLISSPYCKVSWFWSSVWSSICKTNQGYSIIFLDQGFVQGTSTRAGNIAEHLRIPSITTSLCVSIAFILHQTSIHSPDKYFVFF